MTFRPFQPWLWLNCTALTICSLAALALAVLARDRRWLLLVAPATLQVLVLIAQYHAHAITISGASLICRRGILRTRATTVPIVRLSYEIRHTLLGRLLDYGTVRIVTPSGPIEVRRIASIRMLQAIIAERQTDLYAMPGAWRQ
jgi:uncharacterized membrane protein YdbT with pleckstrin-like domain